MIEKAFFFVAAEKTYRAVHVIVLCKVRAGGLELLGFSAGRRFFCPIKLTTLALLLKLRPRASFAACVPRGPQRSVTFPSRSLAHRRTVSSAVSAVENALLAMVPFTANANASLLFKPRAGGLRGTLTAPTRARAVSAAREASACCA